MEFRLAVEVNLGCLAALLIKYIRQKLLNKKSFTGSLGFSTSLHYNFFCKHTYIHGINTDDLALFACKYKQLSE